MGDVQGVDLWWGVFASNSTVICNLHLLFFAISCIVEIFLLQWLSSLTSLAIRIIKDGTSYAHHAHLAPCLLLLSRVLPFWRVDRGCVRKFSFLVPCSWLLPCGRRDCQLCVITAWYRDVRLDIDRDIPPTERLSVVCKTTTDIRTVNICVCIVYHAQLAQLLSQHLYLCLQRQILNFSFTRWCIRFDTFREETIFLEAYIWLDMFCCVTDSYDFFLDLNLLLLEHVNPVL